MQKGSQNNNEAERAQLEGCSLYKYMNGTNEDDDPLLRREQFAISLRKKKKNAIIGSKRKKTMESLRRQ